MDSATRLAVIDDWKQALYAAAEADKHVIEAWTAVGEAYRADDNHAAFDALKTLCRWGVPNAHVGDDVDEVISIAEAVAS